MTKARHKLLTKMVPPTEEQEPLLPTNEITEHPPNNTAVGVNGLRSKFGKVQQCLVKNAVTIFAATLVTVGVLLFGAVVISSECDHCTPSLRGGCGGYMLTKPSCCCYRERFSTCTFMFDTHLCSRSCIHPGLPQSRRRCTPL